MNYLDFVIERNSQKLKMKKELRNTYFPIGQLVVSGESILRSISHLEFLGPIVKGIIYKIIPNSEGPHLRISYQKYTFIKKIFSGYLSEKETVILFYNSFIHLHDLGREKFDYEKILEKTVFSRKHRNLYQYLQFLKYINEISNYLEYGQSIDVAAFMKNSASFQFDPVLKQFTNLINIFLEASISNSNNRMLHMQKKLISELGEIKKGNLKNAA